MVMGSAFTACRHEDVFHRPLEQALLTTLIRDTSDLKAGQEAMRDDIALVHTEVSRLRDDLNQREQALVDKAEKLAKDLHLQTGLLIGVVRRYSNDNPDDFDGALAGVEHALETAAKERAKGRLPGNMDAAVTAVLARMDALNDAGLIDAAEAELLDELARAKQHRCG